ncbi:hypothetical protein [Chryseobacterium aquaticum]|uniref:hypothetical protein n=1 Tax=Chryseobacterium aquaticum TaxID=452084 RepID=UPI002FCCB42C
MTKQYFKEILFSALEEAREEHEKLPNDNLNTSIYNQLIDIKKKVIDEDYNFSEEESRKRYTLGILVIRNFDGYLDLDWNYPKKLIDIAGGISRYPNMPEK